MGSLTVNFYQSPRRAPDPLPSANCNLNTPAGGAVILRAFDSGGQVAVEVSDTGCGIPAELMERVSDPFFTTKTRGVGLGLSISRQLCELNGGRMTIESAPEHGTVVRILLPIAKTSHADHPDH